MEQIQPGDKIRVKRRQGTFTVSHIVTDETGSILGYQCRDKDLKNRAFRKDDVKPAKKRRKKRKAG